MSDEVDTWEAGATFVFVGTVLEDATAGTHVSSLTVTPGQGNEARFMYGRFVAGAGAANLFDCFITDGTNLVTSLAGPGLSLASGLSVNLPSNGTPVASEQLMNSSRMLISGTMQFKMQVSTATTGLTHTFAAAFRMRGSEPSGIVLADNVGAPTPTVVTSRFF